MMVVAENIASWNFAFTIRQIGWAALAFVLLVYIAQYSKTVRNTDFGGENTSTFDMLRSSWERTTISLLIWWKSITAFGIATLFMLGIADLSILWAVGGLFGLDPTFWGVVASFVVSVIGAGDLFHMTFMDLLIVALATFGAVFTIRALLRAAITGYRERDD